MAYAAVETWDIDGDAFPATVQVLRRGVSTPIDGGMIQRRQTFSSQSSAGQAARRRFTFNFTTATKADYNRAVAIWNNTTGGSQGITFVTTNEAYTGTETLIVRMVAAPFALNKAAHGRYTFVVVLEEMFRAP